MRRWGFVSAVLVAALLGAACDTSQPSQGGTTTASVEIEAQALVELVDCYDWFNNGVFERVVCFPSQATSVTRRVPWRYAIRLVGLRSGQTQLEVIASSFSNDGAFPTFGSVTNFDTQTDSAPIRLPDGTYTFENPRRVSKGNRLYFEGRLDNFGNPSPILPIPEPNILGETAPDPVTRPSYELELDAGDSIVVEAAKQPNALGPPIFPQGQVPNLWINGRLFIEGAPATPHAGTVESSHTIDGSGFSFNYISD